MRIPDKPRIEERARVESMADFEAMYRESLENPEAFWLRQAGQLSWFHSPATVLDVDFEEVDFSWFGGGLSAHDPRAGLHDARVCAGRWPIQTSSIDC